MTDDLTPRLRPWREPHMEILRILLDKAADRIEALEAVIAEADAPYHASAKQTVRGFETARDMHAILSHVPQGAAELNPYEAMIACQRDAEDAAEHDRDRRNDGEGIAVGAMPEPWTDPKPWISPDHKSRRDSRRWVGWHHEQYDAEEGNR